MRRISIYMLMLVLAVVLVAALPGCPRGASPWRTELGPGQGYFAAVSGSGPGHVYCVGTGSPSAPSLVYRFDGNNWAPVNIGTARSVSAVSVQSDTSAYAVDDADDFWRYKVVNGIGSWAALPVSANAPASLQWGLWSNPSSRLYSVGTSQQNKNRVHIYDGSVWTYAEFDSTAALYGVGGTSDDNVFAVGQGGLIVHYDGVAARILESGSTVDLKAVWVASATRAYAVGDDGVVLRYDGQEWHEMDSGVTSFLSGIWGAGNDDMFAVGGNGVVIHYNGRNWRPRDSGVTGGLFSV